MLVFADTYFFIGLINPRDQAHPKCVALAQQPGLKLVTTTWIFAELGDGLADTPNRRLFSKVVANFRSSPHNMVVATTDDQFEKGLALYDARHDKGWSLTDCISFVVMQEHNLTDALTGDHHFTQAGFNCLLQ